MKYSVAVLLGLTSYARAAENDPTTWTDEELEEGMRQAWFMDKDFDSELNSYEYLQAWKLSDPTATPETIAANMAVNDCDGNGKMNWFEVKRSIRNWVKEEAKEEGEKEGV